jgi:hypothetical protein
MVFRSQRPLISPESMLFLVQAVGTVAVNAIPLVGVLWFGWSVFEVLLLYWFENVAVGIAHTIRLGISTRTNAVADGWGTTSFFAMHYGIFTFVHGIFVLIYFGIVQRGVMELEGGFSGPVLAIMGWQAAILALDYLRSDAFKDRLPNDMLFEPYPRVFALHLTVVFGGWFIDEVGAPVWALAILVAVKTFADLAIMLWNVSFTVDSTGVVSALRKPRD